MLRREKPLKRPPFQLLTLFLLQEFDKLLGGGDA